MATSDLESLRCSDQAAAAEIVVLLEEIAGDQDLLFALSLEDFEDDRVSVDQFRWLQRRRCLNVWRLKAADFTAAWVPYRIIYAFDAQRKIYYVLKIVHRSFEYERDRGTVAAIEAAYDDLGIQRLPSA